MSKSRIRAVGFSVLLLSVIFAAGCGKGSTSGVLTSDEAKHMRHVAGLVSEYQQASKKKPAKIEEVRDWAVKESKASNEDFLSSRDKEPYGIAFTAEGIIVYERTGKDGKCYVMRRGGVMEMSAEDVRRLVKQEELGPSGRPQRKKDKPS